MHNAYVVKVATRLGDCRCDCDFIKCLTNAARLIVGRWPLLVSSTASHLDIFVHRHLLLKFVTICARSFGCGIKVLSFRVWVEFETFQRQKREGGLALSECEEKQVSSSYLFRYHRGTYISTYCSVLSPQISVTAHPEQS